MKDKHMQNLKLILVGLGGQGVVFFTRLLAQTAVSLGLPVMVSETHGMSQRGGAVISHLKIAGSEAPLIQRGTADVLLAMEINEAIRNLPFVRKGGTVVVNTQDKFQADLTEHLNRLNIQVFTLAASQMAMDLGTVAVANVILTGFAVAHSALPLPLKALEETIVTIAPKGQKLNLQALQLGFNAATAN